MLSKLIGCFAFGDLAISPSVEWQALGQLEKWPDFLENRPSAFLRDGNTSKFRGKPKPTFDSVFSGCDMNAQCKTNVFSSQLFLKFVLATIVFYCWLAKFKNSDKTSDKKSEAWVIRIQKADSSEIHYKPPFLNQLRNQCDALQVEVDPKVYLHALLMMWHYAVFGVDGERAGSSIAVGDWERIRKHSFKPASHNAFRDDDEAHGICVTDPGGRNAIRTHLNDDGMLAVEGCGEGKARAAELKVHMAEDVPGLPKDGGMRTKSNAYLAIVADCAVQKVSQDSKGEVECYFAGDRSTFKMWPEWYTKQASDNDCPKSVQSFINQNFHGADNAKQLKVLKQIVRLCAEYSFSGVEGVRKSCRVAIAEVGEALDELRHLGCRPPHDSFRGEKHGVTVTESPDKVRRRMTDPGWKIIDLRSGGKIRASEFDTKATCQDFANKADCLVIEITGKECDKGFISVFSPNSATEKYAPKDLKWMLQQRDKPITAEDFVDSWFFDVKKQKSGQYNVAYETNRVNPATLVTQLVQKIHAAEDLDVSQKPWSPELYVRLRDKVTGDVATWASSVQKWFHNVLNLEVTLAEIGSFVVRVDGVSLDELQKRLPSREHLADLPPIVGPHEEHIVADISVHIPLVTTKLGSWSHDRVEAVFHHALSTSLSGADSNAHESGGEPLQITLRETVVDPVLMQGWYREAATVECSHRALVDGGFSDEVDMVINKLPNWAVSPESKDLCMYKRDVPFSEFANYVTGHAYWWARRCWQVIYGALLVFFLVVTVCGVRDLSPLFIAGLPVALFIAYSELQGVKDVLLPLVLANKGHALPTRCGLKLNFTQWILSGIALSMVSQMSLFTNAFMAARIAGTIGTSEFRPWSLLILMPWLVSWAHFLYGIMLMHTWIVPKWSYKVEMKMQGVNPGWWDWDCTYGEATLFLAPVARWSSLSQLVMRMFRNRIETLADYHWTKEGVAQYTETRSSTPANALSSPAREKAPLAKDDIQKVMDLCGVKQKDELINKGWFTEGAPLDRGKCWQHRAVKRVMVILKTFLPQAFFHTMMTALMMLGQSIQLNEHFGKNEDSTQILIGLVTLTLNWVSICLLEANTCMEVYSAEKLVKGMCGSAVKEAHEKVDATLAKIPECHIPVCEEHYHRQEFIKEYDLVYGGGRKAMRTRFRVCTTITVTLLMLTMYSTLHGMRYL